MAKGLNKAKNKQAAFLDKLAKAHNNQQKDNADLSDEEVKERNDRLRFEELLMNGAFSNDDSSDSYLNREQEEEEITATRKCSLRFFEALISVHLVTYKSNYENDLRLHCS
jgi:hypothetical protein